MTEDDLSFLPLRVTRVGVGGNPMYPMLDITQDIQSEIRHSRCMTDVAQHKLCAR